MGEAECLLREAGPCVAEPQSAGRIVLVGCGWVFLSSHHGLEEGRREQDLYSLQMTDCSDSEGYPSTSSLSGLSSRTWRQCCLQHRGLNLWILQHPHDKSTLPSLHQLAYVNTKTCQNGSFMHSFMHMMFNIVGKLNFTSLLCYLDDLLDFTLTEEDVP